MARELEFAFGNEIPQAQHWGLIIFKTPISLCRLLWKRCFFSGSWGSCPSAESPSFIHHAEKWGAGWLGGWDEDVHVSSGY